MNTPVTRQDLVREMVQDAVHAGQAAEEQLNRIAPFTDDFEHPVYSALYQALEAIDALTAAVTFLNA